MNSGVHSSLHSHCHYQIIYAKFNLKVFYPPPCQKTMWHFSQENTDHIKKAIDQSELESRLNKIEVNVQVTFLTKQLSVLCLLP